MIAATPQQQRRLLDLQAVDTQVRQLQHRRANLPEQKALDEHTGTLEAVNAEFAKHRDELSSSELAQKRLEQEIATVDARRKSEEGRMFSGMITSERELTAIRQELTSLKGRKSDLEDELLEVMEHLEELESLVATLKSRSSELEDQLPALRAGRDDAATEIDADLSEQTARRDEIAGELPDDLVRHYEELRGRKQGLGVAELSGHTCMGCRLQLTASELEETKRDAARYLALCPQCGRAIVPT